MTLNDIKNDINEKSKSVTVGQMDGRKDERTKRGVESRARDLKE